MESMSGPPNRTDIAARSAKPSSDRILDIAFAFRKSKVLLSAVELDLFSELGGDAVVCEELAERLGVHQRGARDFFDALVALELLDRDRQGRYANRPDYMPYLDRRSPSYLGGRLDHVNSRLYRHWGRLTQALRSGEAQSDLGTGGYAALYADRSAFETFLGAMSGGSLLPALTLARAFPWRSYRTVVDVGTAQGCVPVELARMHPHLGGGGFDLPQVEPEFTRFVRSHGMEQRLRFYPGDFLKDELPRADVLIMGRILHNWDLPTKVMLLQKAYRALAPGGALIVYDTLIDDARRHETEALLASLNMLIETAGGFEYTATQCTAWMRDCGFDEMRVESLDGGESAVIGLKPHASAGIDAHRARDVITRPARERRQLCIVGAEPHTTFVACEDSKSSVKSHKGADEGSSGAADATPLIGKLRAFGRRLLWAMQESRRRRAALMCGNTLSWFPHVPRVGVRTKRQPVLDICIEVGRRTPSSNREGET
jgi:hypothetical protein